MTETKMVAGRALDAEVAEKVMGWTRIVPGKIMGDVLGRPPGEQIQCLPRYSTDMTAAWEVVDELRKRKISFVLGGNGCAAQWTAWFTDGIWALAKQQNAVPEHGSIHLRGSATADTAPLAICLAALKAASAT